jgi:hypothetical protein
MGVLHCGKNGAMSLRPAALAALLCGCGALLPRSEIVTESPWRNFSEAQAVFERIVPGVTTLEDLKALRLDPQANPNITILNYSDVLRRFIPNPSISAGDLDAGVRECISAKTVCRGLEIDQRSLERQRYGNFWADFLNFRRKVDIRGWRFNGLLLLKDGVVVYKLTGGQPEIREHEQSNNPLGPLQGLGESRILNAF